MKNNMQEKINDLNKKIKKTKLIRDAYSLLGHSQKVQENNQAIFELETKLIKMKLDSAK
ncbi:MAG: hypothetical protein GX638_06855 [Crenarchaeota archaeon]|nr:hypothetical protein [Thermoproteota archaeon]